MSANATSVALKDTEDGSAVLAGTDTDTLVTAGGKVAKGFLSALDRQEGTSLAFALLLGIVALVTRDEGGFPSWSVSDWTDSARSLFAAMLDKASLSEDDGKRLMQNVRAAWSRSSGSGNIRDMFISCYVLDNYDGAKVNGTAEVGTQAARNYNAALKVLGPELVAMLPEILQEGPFNATNVNAAFKKGAKEQLRHYSLSVPERFGGEPKDGNAKGTKDKQATSVETDMIETATQAIAGHVGTEGGSSYLSVSRGSLAVTSALVAEIIAANEVQDREDVEKVLLRLSEVSRIGAKVLAGKGTEEDATRFGEIAYSPEADK